MARQQTESWSLRSGGFDTGAWDVGIEASARDPVRIVAVALVAWLNVGAVDRYA